MVQDTYDIYPAKESSFAKIILSKTVRYSNVERGRSINIDPRRPITANQLILSF